MNVFNATAAWKMWINRISVFLHVLCSFFYTHILLCMDVAGLTVHHNDVYVIIIYLCLCFVEFSLDSRLLKLPFDWTLGIAALSLCMMCVILEDLGSIEIYKTSVTMVTLNTISHLIIGILYGFCYSIILKTQLWIKTMQNFFKRYTLVKFVLYVTLILVKYGLMSAVIIGYVYIGPKHLSFYFDKAGGVREVNSDPIYMNDCIPYDSFPDQLNFTSDDMVGRFTRYKIDSRFSFMEIKNVTHNMYKHALVTNSKLCKSYPGEDFLISVRTPKLYDGWEVYWKFNGSYIDPTRAFSRYKLWEKTNTTCSMHYLLVSFVEESDFGLYELYTNTNQSYSANTINRLLYEKSYHYSVHMNVVDTYEFKMIKVRLVSEAERVETTTTDVGKLLMINNMFKIHIDVSAEHRDIAGGEYLINGISVSDACPYNSDGMGFQPKSLSHALLGGRSCLPTVGFAHLFQSMKYFSANSVVSDGVNVTTVNVSFCVCPRAYGVHEFYFVETSGLRIRAAAKIKLLPPVDSYFNQDYSVLFREFMIAKTEKHFENIFEHISGNLAIKEIYLNDKDKLFGCMSMKETVVLIITFISCSFVIIAIDKIINIALYLIFHFKWTNFNTILQDPAPREFDVFVSYCEDSPADQQFAQDILIEFLKDKCGYKVCSGDTVRGPRKKGYEQLMRNSKRVIIVFSEEYLEDDWCIGEQYNYLLIPFLTMERVFKTGDVLVINNGHYVSEKPSDMKMFRTINWVDTVLNIRADKDKLEDIQTWLVNSLGDEGLLQQLLDWIKSKLSRPARICTWLNRISSDRI